MADPRASTRHAIRRRGYFLVEAMAYVVVVSVVLTVIYSLYYALSQGAFGVENHGEVIVRCETVRAELSRDVRLCDGLARRAGDICAGPDCLILRMRDGSFHIWVSQEDGQGLGRQTFQGGAAKGVQPFLNWGEVRFEIRESRGSPREVVVDVVHRGHRGKDRFGAVTALSFCVFSETLKWTADADGPAPH